MLLSLGINCFHAFDVPPVKVIEGKFMAVVLCDQKGLTCLPKKKES